MQTYLGLRKISSEAATTESYLQSIIGDHSLDEITLLFEIDDKISYITNNIETFGSVMVQKTPCQIFLVRGKNKQAQLVETKIETSIADIKFKLQEITETTIYDIKGIVVLPSGNIALAGYVDRKIVVFSTYWGRLCKIEVNPFHAIDVTYIDDNTIATTLNSKTCKGVNIIDIGTEKITKYIPTKNTCYGIIHHNGSLFVCSSNIHDSGILKLNPHDGSSTTIVNISLLTFSYIQIFDNKIYNTSSQSVTCYDMQGKQIWTIEDGNTLKHVRGIAVDNSGNVYVACTTSHRVVVTYPDGQQCRDLLSRDDGLKDPSAIHFDRTSNCQLIANKIQKVFTYEIVN